MKFERKTHTYIDISCIACTTSWLKENFPNLAAHPRLISKLNSWLNSAYAPQNNWLVDDGISPRPQLVRLELSAVCGGGGCGISYWMMASSGLLQSCSMLFWGGQATENNLPGDNWYEASTAAAAAAPFLAVVAIWRLDFFFFGGGKMWKEKKGEKRARFCSKAPILFYLLFVYNPFPPASQKLSVL